MKTHCYVLKMNLSFSGGLELAAAVRIMATSRRRVVIALQSAMLAPIATRLSDSPIKLAAQTAMG